MGFSFSAIIYKTGINLCVDVPLQITVKMLPGKGYIPIIGEINGFAFTQTLVPVKNSEYRLFVNGIMLKGCSAQLGDTVQFNIQQDLTPPTAANIPMHSILKKALDKNNVSVAFKKLTPYRQKEILHYLNYLKTEDAVIRNVAKVIADLKKS